jgi:hypothetical protein
VVAEVTAFVAGQPSATTVPSRSDRVPS